MTPGSGGRLPAAVLLVLGLAGCTPCCDEDCPAIYLVKGDADDPGRFNVVLVGDGFRSPDQLHAYRAAVGQLVRGLDDIAPFNDHTDEINFYRVDVLDAGGVADACDYDADACTGTPEECAVEEAACSIEELDPKGPFEPADPLIAGSGLLERDLEVSLCFKGPGICNSLGMPLSAETSLLRILARNGPSFDAVVVVANTENVAGGASLRVGGETNVAIVGVPLAGGEPDWRVSESAVQLFAHELSHTIGLYDEYGGSGGDYPEVEAGRNVWKPGASVSLTSALADPTMEIPWKSRMSCDTPTECLWPETPCDDATGMGCIFVPHIASSSTGCIPAELCDAHAGLWEGAHYHNSGHYRSHRYCRMERLSEEFCEACVLALDRLLCCWGEGPCDLCP